MTTGMWALLGGIVVLGLMHVSLYVSLMKISRRLDEIDRKSK
jgi:hypothetical protein